MTVASATYEEMTASQRNTICALGAISALGFSLSAASFESTVKDHAQSYFKLGNESYEIAQWAILLVSIIALFALKVFAASAQVKDKEKTEEGKHKEETNAVPAAKQVILSGGSGKQSEREQGNPNKKRKFDEAFNPMKI